MSLNKYNNKAKYIIGRKVNLDCKRDYNSDTSKDMREILRKKKKILEKKIENYRRFNVL